MSERIDKLLAMLKARTDREGRARPGYEQNVAAIKAELAQRQEAMNSAD